jgi:hypothetical protein
LDRLGPFRNWEESESEPPSPSRNNANALRSARQMLLELSVRSNVTPSSLFLKRIFPSTDKAIGYGAHADVFPGTYEDQPVALKRLRVFLQTLDPSTCSKVRFRQEVDTYSAYCLLGFLPRSLIMAPAPTSAHSTISRHRCRLFRILLMYGVPMYGRRQCPAIREE